jgi:DNA-binding Lrp family transcriptional regulator
MKIRIRKRFLFYVLAFTSSILAAILSGMDAFAQQFIHNPWSLGLAVFIAGVLVALCFTLFLSIPYKGKSLGAVTVDPSFVRIRLLKKNEIPYHLLAGLGNAILTTGYFIILSMMKDPSVVLPFSQIVILYLVVLESITDKDTPTLIEVQSSIIVTFGAILGSISLSGTISLTALAIVFLVINPGWVLLSIYQRKLKTMKIAHRPNDAVNIRLYNVTFACIFTIIFVAIYDIINHGHFLADSFTATIRYFNILSIIGVGTFFSFIFYIRALGIGKASVTQAVKSSVIIFSIPVSIVLGYLGIIAPFTSDPVLLLIKFIGTILILLGIISFALTLTKAYIFIKIKPGYSVETLMQSLWDIKGVNHVCAVAGPYDFIIKIRTRTLVKGYERILKKVESVEGIAEYKWQSVLKEWEDV